jgi:hypothetical protein
MKNCARCLKEIKKGESYLKIILYENEKVTETRFIHKTCWSMEIQQRKIMQQANNMLEGAKSFFSEHGIKVPEVYKIGKD